ncbi:Uncharacterized protein MLTONO_3160 [Mesorhizobium loti]|nr:Uncharacterized protein MLTONO_3160 [Mesorhizobium loti]
MKIFWSWQSDTPGKTGRHFIRQALSDAIEALRAAEDIEEPSEREAKDALHLDHDRQGVSGSPDLARTILEKIDQSAVFVADVSPVSIVAASDGAEGGRREKRNMNPNVAIELGYALRALSDRSVVMVLNTHYGDRSYLPFDLAHKAGPIQFNLAPDAEKKTRESVAAELKGSLVAALRPFLKQIASAAQSGFQATPSTQSATVYFQPNETLARFGEEHDRVEFTYTDSLGFYLRLKPWTGLAQPVPRSVLLAELRRTGMFAMWRNPSGLYSPNQYGAIVVEPESPAGGPLKASTQVFSNGEIWGLARWLLVDNNFVKIIPGQAVEQTFRQALDRYVAFARDNLHIAPPYSLEAGAVGLKDRRIFIDQNWDTALGPIYDDAFRVDLVLNDLSRPTLDKALLTIFEELYRAAGYSRPQGLFGFPVTT